MQAWKQAREKTLAAEREAAAAHVSGKKANLEAAEAEAAEEAMHQAQIKHRQVDATLAVLVQLCSLVSGKSTPPIRASGLLGSVLFVAAATVMVPPANSLMLCTA